MIFFGIAYIIIVFTHVTVAKISDSESDIINGTHDFTDEMNLYKGMMVAVSVVYILSIFISAYPWDGLFRYLIQKHL